MSSGSGSSHTAMIEVVDHDAPTDPKQLRATRLKQADAAIKAAKAKITKLKRFISSAATPAVERRQRAHLKGAEKALAQAIADKERIA